MKDYTSYYNELHLKLWDKIDNGIEVSTAHNNK
jgi:hypothetical protein